MENTETPVETQVETEVTEQAVTTENAEPSETVETKPEKTFTQSELDDIITKRLERDRESTSKKAAQAARDSYIAEQNYEWQGKPIKTEAEYKEALREKQLIEQYEEKGYPEEVMQELIEGKKFRERYENDKQQQELSNKQRAEFQEFVDTYPDVDPKTIPQEVWDDVQKGKGLIDSYVRHENKTLKQKLSEIEKSKEIEQQNQDNAASSTGSVTGQGDGKQTTFSQKQVADMSPEDVNKNWDAIARSMKSWKK